MQGDSDAVPVLVEKKPFSRASVGGIVVGYGEVGQAGEAEAEKSAGEDEVEEEVVAFLEAQGVVDATGETDEGDVGVGGGVVGCHFGSSSLIFWASGKRL